MKASPGLASLSASDLVAGYRRGRRTRPIVTAPHLAARRGELTAVVGVNGSGKTTLLRTLVGAQPPLAGRVVVDGSPVANLGRRDRARRLAVVLTDRIEPGLLTVGEVVALGRHPHTSWRGRLAPDDHDAAYRAAVRVGVQGLWDTRFGELSDGQRQRVLVARALAQDPTVLVLDEPTAFLDVSGRLALTTTLAGLAHAGGLAVVVSTHDLDLALDHADAIWLVVDGQVRAGAPEDLLLDGSLTAALAAPGIDIDPATGRPRPRRPHGPPVVVHGEGLEAQLAARAAARVGATCAAPGAVDSGGWHIHPWTGGGRRWLLRRGDHEHTVDSLGELARTLRRHIADSSSG